jgi:hypothetical protein
MTKSLYVWTELYQDYGCQASMKLSWQCFDREFTLKGVPVQAEWYRCNEHGIVLYDDAFNIVKVAPMQQYKTGKGETRYFLLGVYDNNLLRLIEQARCVELPRPAGSVVRR